MTTPTPTSNRAPATRRALVQTHPCARCGAAVALDIGLCERCNPLGLRDAASSQVHGTVFLAVALAIVAMAVIAKLAIAGIGPFTARVAGVDTDATGALTVSLQVTNEGSSTGSTTCRISDPFARSAGQPAFVLSPRIGSHETITFSHTLEGYSGPIRPLDVECSAP